MQSIFRAALLFRVTLQVDNVQNQKTFLKALPNSFMSFHWSSLAKDQLLCVSIEDIPNCCWSGGFKIDTINSMHINIRDPNSRVYFLRLEVVLQDATFYVIFTDADKMPPPIRVDNFSEVAIKFGQSCFIDAMHSTGKPLSHAWVYTMVQTSPNFQRAPIQVFRTRGTNAPNRNTSSWWLQAACPAPAT